MSRGLSLPGPMGLAVLPRGRILTWRRGPGKGEGAATLPAAGQSITLTRGTVGRVDIRITTAGNIMCPGGTGTWVIGGTGAPGRRKTPSPGPCGTAAGRSNELTSVTTTITAAITMNVVTADAASRKQHIHLRAPLTFLPPCRWLVVLHRARAPAPRRWIRLRLTRPRSPLGLCSRS